MARMIELHTILGSEQLRFASLRAEEGMSQVSEFELEALSPSADLDIKQLLGTDVTIEIDMADGATRYVNALVTAFAYAGHGSSVQNLHRYKATLRSWLALAEKNADYRIFQDQSVPDIVREVLGRYQFSFELNLIGRYTARPYVVQYGESDFNFVARLCEDEGIYHYCTHSADHHTIVFTDFSHDRLPHYPSIAFQSSDQRPDVGDECIFAWNGALSLQAGRYATDSYDFRKARAQLDQQSVARKEHPHDNQEIYAWSGAYTERAHGEHLALVRRQQQQLDHHCIHGSTNVRGLAPGYIFKLREHPCSASNGDYLIIAARYVFEEQRELSGTHDGARWHTDFVVKPASEQYRPPRRAARPQAVGPQTAVVTGPAGREIWTNEYGQVKVHFRWDRHGRADENSSCWIRVASSWAGARWGESLIPRIGQEVVVEHLHGDPDLPLITGRVSNQGQMPPAFSHAGRLPADQALGGIKSKEHQGRRYNQLLFDDTTGEIRAQLESEHAKSQLNLGFLSHPRNGGSAEPRGEGFELRTDAWGALRAAKGLLITTDGRSAAAGGALSREELVRCLQAALDIAKGLGETAAQHAGGASDHAPQAKLCKAVKDWGHGSNAETGGNGGTPLFAVSSPGGITLATPESSTIAAGRHLDLVAEHNQHITAGQGMHLHAGQGINQFAFGGGIRSIAHQGKQVIQAQHDDIEIAADQSVTITASHKHVMIAADRHVTLASGGAYIKLAGGNIEIHCPGSLSLKGATHSILGPASMGTELPSFGAADTGKRFVLNYGAGETPVPGKKYRITMDDGKVHEGVSDAKGRTDLVENEQMRVAHIEILKD
jgi:type VI secretion system secreted protein VgrG